MYLYFVFSSVCFFVFVLKLVFDVKFVKHNLEEISLIVCIVLFPGSFRSERSLSLAPLSSLALLLPPSSLIPTKMELMEFPTFRSFLASFFSFQATIYFCFLEWNRWIGLRQHHPTCQPQHQPHNWTGGGGRALLRRSNKLDWVERQLDFLPLKSLHPNAVRPIFVLKFLKKIHVSAFCTLKI